MKLKILTLNLMSRLVRYNHNHIYNIGKMARFDETDQLILSLATTIIILTTYIIILTVNFVHDLLNVTMA